MLHKLRVAVIGAGPVGLALALHAARTLPDARIDLFDARPLERDVSGDARTLALALGSVQLLQRLDAWPQAAAQPITRVHVSQQPPSGLPWIRALDEPELLFSAADEGVPMLGAVLSYGALVGALQRAWLDAATAASARLRTRFGVAVRDIKVLAGAGVEVDAEIAEPFDIAVVAEGGVFAEQERKAVTLDYRQTAWVGPVRLAQARPGIAYERFTRHGPAALLPLQGDGTSAALVWCVAADGDPVRNLDDRQRRFVLDATFHPSVGRIAEVGPLKDFALGLNAERSLVHGRTIRIGNAAQTLHPVAGQGLNLGLRDAFALVFALRDASSIDAALRRVEWARAPDRWSMIAATDFFARSFTWPLPGLGTARGLGLAALQALGPVKSMLARQMMFGSR